MRNPLTNRPPKKAQNPHIANLEIFRDDTRVGLDAKDGALLAQVANRIQNKQILYRVNMERPTEAQVVIAEQCDKWLEVSDLPKQLSTGEYLRLSDLPTGRRRLWRISQDGSTRQPVTPEEFHLMKTTMEFLRRELSSNPIP
jgi:hypothetical protein